MGARSRHAGFLVTVAAAALSAQTVQVWLTTADLAARLQPQPAIQFTPAASPAETPIVVYPRTAYQRIEGFGASMTDSAAWLLATKVPPARLPAIMESLFSPTAGIGVSFLRNPMGASDLARFHYSYDDNRAGFSLAHDEEAILPLLRQARALNPSLRMMGSPWSPPGWMKTTGTMIGGALLPSSYAAFADYLLKYAESYAADGVPVDYLSLQNEPLYVPTDYPGCAMTAAEQRTLLRDFVLPAFAARGLTTRFLVYDHNWDNTAYARDVLSDPALASSPRLAGVAWHWYGGPPGAMTTLHHEHPHLGQFVTEASSGTWITEPVRADFEAIIHSLRNWARSFVKWSLALDTNRGPHAGGCGTCSGLISVDQQTGEVTNMPDYYTLGHFSRFIPPGSVRVWSNNAPGLISAAFQQPGGSIALVVFNDSARQRDVQVLSAGRALSYALPAWSAATFVWNPEPEDACANPGASFASWRDTCRPPVFSARQRTMASSYDRVQGLQSEACTDEDNGFNLGYASSGSWALFRHLLFDGRVSTLTARVANAGAATSIEFRLDAHDGPLLSSVAVPSTGGWQSWRTFTAPTSSAYGDRNLFVVFRGAANLNWFAFK